MRPLSAVDIPRDTSDEYATYLRHFVHQRAQFHRTMTHFGVDVACDKESPLRISALQKKLMDAGAVSRNAGKSIAWRSISPACERCRNGVKSVSEFISLACHRTCWFCFNENQCDYETYKAAKKDWKSELHSFQDSMGELDCVALTGGEPLLYPNDTCEFFRYARENNPNAHLRLYTSGDQLTETLLEQLRHAGLDEIRFSIKLDDTPEQQQRTWNNIRSAVNNIASVMVEMPVIPGTHSEMQNILRKLEQTGAFGINLLELCFPLHHASEFTARNFKLKDNPYRVLYDYGYAGALPVEGSEELALQLMLEEVQRNTVLHIHYCSLENKNTAQIYEQNSGGARIIPLYSFSQSSFFYVTLRCFGNDALLLADALEATQCAHALDVEGHMVQFAPESLAAVLPFLTGAGAGVDVDAGAGAGAGADADAGISTTADTNANPFKLFASFGVIERDSLGNTRLREVDALVVEPCDYHNLCASVSVHAQREHAQESSC